MRSRKPNQCELEENAEIIQDPHGLRVGRPTGTTRLCEKGETGERTAKALFEKLNGVKSAGSKSSAAAI